MNVFAVCRRLFDIVSTPFILSRRLLKPATRSAMPRWQDRLFIALTRISNDATSYFQISAGRVVEIGTPVTISALSAGAAHRPKKRV